MRSIQQWLDEYNESHQDPRNKVLHWICVPLIMMSLLGLLWPLSLSIQLSDATLSINLAVIVVLLAMVYYSYLSVSLSIGMLFVSASMFFLLSLVAAMQTPLWAICLVIFVLAWIGQFIGHQLEGRRPSFFKDVQFLLIGPLWLLSFIYKRLGLSY